MSSDFALLMEHLRKKTAEVELDVPSPQTSGDAATATRLARARQAAIRRGDRVARMYKLVDGKRATGPDGVEPRPSLQNAITENECKTLLAAGARWIGPEAYKPVARRIVERVRIRNFRCLQGVEFPLTPLHALIGPNDSGKSTILEALASIGALVGGGSPDPASEVIVFSDGHAATVSNAAFIEHEANVTAADALKQSRARGNSPGLHQLVVPFRILRLDPDEMREPTNLIAHGRPIEYTARGKGLAAVYDAFLSRRLDVFLEISKRFTTLFRPPARSSSPIRPRRRRRSVSS